MDTKSRSVVVGLGQQSSGAFGCAQIGEQIEAAERRSWLQATDRSEGIVRLIIPPWRDRWFKSSPRNQVFRPEWMVVLGLTANLRRRIYFLQSSKPRLTGHEPRPPARQCNGAESGLAWGGGFSMRQ